MRFIGGIIGGVVAGVIGAAIWALIAYYAHVQIGFVAWIIGGMVGVGVAMGCRGDTGTETGALAAIIAILAIMGGKYATAYAFVSDYMPKSTAYTEEQAQVHMARDVARQNIDAGKTLVWPTEKTVDDAEKPAHFPKDIWKDVTARWGAMQEAERTDYRAQCEADFKSRIESGRGKVVMLAFKESFTIFSIVFIGFALFTAFKVGGGLSGGD